MLLSWRKKEEKRQKGSQNCKYGYRLIENIEARIREEAKKTRENDLVLFQQSKTEAMGEMISSIGEQWFQHLNSLTLLIQDVREALEFGEVDEHYIDRFISESTDQINLFTVTLNDIRDYYKKGYEMEFFSVAESVEEAFSIIGPSLNKHNIKIVFKFDGKKIGYGLKNEFIQVMLDLLTYIKNVFLQKDIQKRKIIINLFDKDNEIVTELIANSQAIENKIQEKKLHTHFTTSMQGNSLGLYMSKMTIEKMNGHFSAEAAENGTRYCLVIPKEKKKRPSGEVPAI